MLEEFILKFTFVVEAPPFPETLQFAIYSFCLVETIMSQNSPDKCAVKISQEASQWESAKRWSGWINEKGVASCYDTGNEPR